MLQGAVTDYAYERYSNCDEARDGLLPGLDNVPWGEVLRLIADRDFQQARTNLHADLATALEAGNLTDDERAERIEEAYDRHIAFLSEQDRRFAIVRRGRNLFRTERGEVRFAHDQQAVERWTRFSQVGLKGLVGVAAGFEAVALHDANGVLTGLVGGLTDLLNAPGAAIGSTVAGFLRPSEESFAQGAGLLTAAKSRKNLFIG